MSNADKKATVGNIAAFYQKLKEKFMPNQTPQELRAAMGLGDTLGPLGVEYGGSGGSDLSALVKNQFALFDAIPKCTTVSMDITTPSYTSSDGGGYTPFMHVREDGSYLAIAAETAYLEQSFYARRFRVTGTLSNGTSAAGEVSLTRTSMNYGTAYFYPMCFAPIDNDDGSFTAYFLTYDTYLEADTIITLSITADGVLSISGEVLSSRLTKSYHTSDIVNLSFRCDDGSWVSFHRSTTSYVAGYGEVMRFSISADGVASAIAVTPPEGKNTPRMPGDNSSTMSVNDGSRIRMHDSYYELAASLDMSGEGNLICHDTPEATMVPVIFDTDKMMNFGTDASGAQALAPIAYEFSRSSSAVTAKQMPGIRSSVDVSGATVEDYSFISYKGLLAAVSSDGKTVIECNSGVAAYDAMRTAAVPVLTGHISKGPSGNTAIVLPAYTYLSSDRNVTKTVNAYVLTMEE